MEIRPILLSLKQNKFMTILIALQVALTMAVLSSAILTTLVTLRAWNMPSGIPHDNIIRINADFYDDSQDLGAAMQRDLQRLSAQPGVEAIARTYAVPFRAENVLNVFTSQDENAAPMQTALVEAETSLFDVLELTLLDGRWLSVNDEVIEGAASGQRAASVMISADLAKALFAGQSAVGKTLWLSKGGDPVQVVGVYSNMMTGENLNGRGLSYHSLIRPQLLWSQENEPEYLIRVDAGKGAAMIEEIVSLFYQEQGRYVGASELLTRVQKRMYDGRGSRAMINLVISAVLMLITALGIAGLTSFQVNQRRKQIGTRRALGARKSDIIRYFLTENALVTLFGCLLGLLVTLYLMFELSERDEENYLNMGVIGLIVLGMWAINAIATWLPARKAAQISPAIVTRGN
ncbi:ABC transporter permease [Bowmanella sp. Y26]|uniref:ABC transporter permease n=1 Tax=Bowmanella yangjiangensis TaxID=2811230 RepID=UPI001BDCD234|nr:FtsX-like permease family protein [Bowmanella yangjiangensis]MBT1063206.1 ABC transporter permease [Bowmanella yangjiangensis]